MPTKHAVALRAFDHAGVSFDVGSVHRIDAGHLADWSAAGLVREATAAEIAKAKGDSTEKTAPRAAAKRPRKGKPAPQIAAPAADPDPAATAA